jgi:hypothetical protein
MCLWERQNCRRVIRMPQMLGRWHVTYLVFYIFTFYINVFCCGGLASGAASQPTRVRAFGDSTGFNSESTRILWSRSSGYGFGIFVQIVSISIHLRLAEPTFGCSFTVLCLRTARCGTDVKDNPNIEQVPVGGCRFGVRR